MQNVPFWAAALTMVMAAQTGVQPSDRYRDEFKLRPETARISEAFSIDAWIVLLYTSRQGSTGIEDQQASRVDDVMESLRNEIKTDGEWLFWYRLNSYSIAKQLMTTASASTGLVPVQDAQACREALMIANRSRIMAASMPACELAPQKPLARTP